MIIADAFREESAMLLARAWKIVGIWRDTCLITFVRTRRDLRSARAVSSCGERNLRTQYTARHDCCRNLPMTYLARGFSQRCVYEVRLKSL
ncbi:MAG: hypothetical protein ACRYGF_07430 [Janthinobacterium lividum]